jgi:hypothetical protein
MQVPPPEKLPVAKVKPDRVPGLSEANPGSLGFLATQPRPRECEETKPAAMVEAAPTTEPRAVLEIEELVPLSADLIRRQFRLLSERYARTKVEALGTDFVMMAQAKHDAVRRAAEALIAEFGEPLEPATATPPSADLRANPDLDAVFGG